MDAVPIVPPLFPGTKNTTLHELQTHDRSRATDMPGSAYCCAAMRALGSNGSAREARVTTPDNSKVSEDRREALRYALAIGSGAALASALVSPASAQASADNTLDRVRANKVLRIAVLPGELPYFNKDLATGNWSGFSIEMANDIAKLLDVKLEYTESTYGNSILDLQSNKIDLAFALNPTPHPALLMAFCGTVFHHPFGAMLKKGMMKYGAAKIHDK